MNKILPAILLLSILSSCKKDLLDASNPNQLTINTYYQTEDQAVGAVNAVYAVLQHMNLFRQHQWLIYDGMSDDVAWASTDDEPANAMFRFTFSPAMAKTNEMWTTLYTGVFRANQVIKGVSAMSDFTLKDRVLAEARFLRAWFYSELVNGWGAVPEITEPLEGAQSSYNFPRAPKDQIYTLIKDDLEFAKQHLPKKSEYDAADAGRATSGAATAYLGKSYLFQGRWADAAGQFLEVINSNEYQLTGHYHDNFSAATENNIESVFEVQFTGDGTGVWANDDSPGVVEGNLLPVSYFRWATLGPMLQFKRNQLYGPASSTRSARYNSTFGQNPNGAPRIIKYVEFNTSDFRNSDVNIRDMRYADVLLMYAEALNESDRTGDAKPYIDKVIERVRLEAGLINASDETTTRDLKTVQQLLDFGGIESYTFTDDKAGIRDVIKYERRVEFMYEQKRYKDLVRWGDAAQAMATWSEDTGESRVFVVGKHELFPIPDSEISGNKGMTPADQNPQY